MRGATRWPVLVAGGLVFVVASITYGATLSYTLVWDDLLILPTLRTPPGENALWHLLTAPFLTDSTYYRPLVLLSLKSDLYLTRLFPGSFHATNVLLHALVSSLVCVFAVVLYRSVVAALVAGLLFAVSPVHTESVAFVSGRTDLWAAAFLLLAAIAWEHGRRSPEYSWKPVALSAVALFCAVASKETAVLLPAVLLTWDLLGNDRRKTSPGFWRSNRPWIIGWALALGVALVLRFQLAGLGFPESVGAAPLLVARLWSAYSRLLILPWPLRSYYTESTLPTGPTDVLLALVIPAVALGTRFLGNKKAGLAALVWLVVFLLPVGFRPPKGAVLATRYLYIPSIGLVLLAACYISRLSSRRYVAGALAIVALLPAVAMGLSTQDATRIWRSNATLYEAFYRDAPEVAMVNFNLANLRWRAGRWEEAERLYRRALQIDPGYRDVLLNLGNALASRDRFEEAEQMYNKLLQLDPDDSRAYGSLGNLRYNSGLWAESAAFFRKAVELNPREPRNHYGLGIALDRIGKSMEAQTHLRRAVELQPDYELALKKLRSLERSPGIPAPQ